MQLACASRRPIDRCAVDDDVYPGLGPDVRVVASRGPSRQSSPIALLGETLRDTY